MVKIFFEPNNREKCARKIRYPFPPQKGVVSHLLELASSVARIVGERHE